MKKLTYSTKIKSAIYEILAKIKERLNDHYAMYWIYKDINDEVADNYLIRYYTLRCLLKEIE